MGSGASSVYQRAQGRTQAHQRSQQTLNPNGDSRSDPEGRGRMTSGEPRQPTFWCHQCQASVNHLAAGSVCPLCQGGFVQESSSVVMLEQAARWFAGGSHSSSMEARIARLLDDLHTHLEMVEDLHESMRNAVQQAEQNGGRQRLDPAPQEVLDAIEVLEPDAHNFEEMRQAAQCVICCADFEAHERLSRLPGCGHLFHDSCVMQWLERSSNCPICRGNLAEAVALTGRPASLEEAVSAEPTGPSTPRSWDSQLPPVSSSSSTAPAASTAGVAAAAEAAAAVANSALAAAVAAADAASSLPSQAAAIRHSTQELVGAGSTMTLRPGSPVTGMEAACGALQGRTVTSQPSW